MLSPSPHPRTLARKVSRLAKAYGYKVGIVEQTMPLTQEAARYKATFLVDSLHRQRSPPLFVHGRCLPTRAQHFSLPQKVPVHLQPVCPKKSNPEAMAAWQWFNVHRNNPHDGEIIFNLDETAIHFGMGPLPGYRPPMAKLRQREPSEPGMTLADRRKTFTAIVTVCNASWLQPMLPQVLVANHRTVRARDLLRQREAVPGKVTCGVKHLPGLLGQPSSVWWASLVQL